KEQLHMRAPRNHRSAGAIEVVNHITGRRHVLTSTRATAPYATGDRFGAGEVLAVLQPGSLVGMWRALQVCGDHDLIVITQAANTGLTGGSGPGGQDYDRDTAILSTPRIDQIQLINDAREAVCAPARGPRARAPADPMRAAPGHRPRSRPHAHPPPAAARRLGRRRRPPAAARLDRHPLRRARARPGRVPGPRQRESEVPVRGLGP